MDYHPKEGAMSPKHSIRDGEHIQLHQQQHIGQICRDRGGNNGSSCTTAEGLCAQEERHNLSTWDCLTSFCPVGTPPSAAKPTGDSDTA